MASIICPGFCSTPRHPGFEKDRICWLWRLEGSQFESTQLGSLAVPPCLSLHSGACWAHTSHLLTVGPRGLYLAFFPLHVCSHHLPSLESTALLPHLPVIFLFSPSSLAPFLLSLLPELALNVRSPPLGTSLKRTCPHPGLQPLCSWLLPDFRLEAGLGAMGWGQIREGKPRSMDMKSWNPVPGRAQSQQSSSHKPQATNPGEEETWVRVMGWKLVSGWPGHCFWKIAAESGCVHR